MKRTKGIRSLVILMTAFISAFIFSSINDAEAASQEATLTGTIVCYETQQPLPGTVIRWKQSEATADAEGAYTLSIKTGMRRIEIKLPDGRDFSKVIRIEGGDESHKVDLIAPGKSRPAGRWILDMGPDYDKSGNELESDFKRHYELWTTDALFNNGEPLKIPEIKGNIHCPQWSPSGEVVAFSVETIPVTKELRESRGIYFYSVKTKKISKKKLETGILNLHYSPDGNRMAAADQKSAFIVDLQKNDDDIEKIVSLAADENILSVTWTPWNAILLTVHGTLAECNSELSSCSCIIINDADDPGKRRFFGEQGRWLRYPLPLDERGRILYASFAENGADAVFKVKNLVKDKPARILFRNGSRPVFWEKESGELFYMKQDDLHVNFIEQSIDLLATPSIDSADYFVCRD